MHSELASIASWPPVAAWSLVTAIKYSEWECKTAFFKIKRLS